MDRGLDLLLPDPADDPDAPEPKAPHSGTDRHHRPGLDRVSGAGPPGASKPDDADAIGAEWADILSRNNLPHYRFYVTSVLRTQEDIKYLQRSGNINSVTQSCHCYGTTFDLAYMRYDKVTRSRTYMHEDNLKLVLGQVLLNHQRAGKIYVKYEAKQSCFHITVRQ